MNLLVTDVAAEFIKKNVDKSQAKGFRISVKKTGCSGYSYLPAVVNSINENDQVFNLPNGITIFVDTAYLDILQNIKIDYVEEERSGLKQKRLVFANPNESSRCGCGESFHVE